MNTCGQCLHAIRVSKVLTDPKDCRAMPPQMFAAQPGVIQVSYPKIKDEFPACGMFQPLIKQ